MFIVVHLLKEKLYDQNLHHSLNYKTVYFNHLTFKKSSFFTVANQQTGFSHVDDMVLLFKWPYGFNRLLPRYFAIQVALWSLLDIPRVKKGTKETVTRDGAGSDKHGYAFECHYLSHFNSNSDMNTNIIEYECRMDISNSNLYSNTYSIYSIES
jgi:hypothetical protein